MIESDNSPENYKTLKISVAEIMKNPEMLKLLSDRIKPKKMSKNAVKRLSI